MAYDNSSLTGDEICDYHYDIENNFMNPPSPTGYFIYKVIGGAFDRLNDLVTQFRIDYSILDCNVGNVEIVKSFPEEPDTTHTYYVAQCATAEERVFTKYSYVDGEWVSETVTGDVLNSLDVFWGRSYNLPRPTLPIPYSLIFNDDGVRRSKNSNWYVRTADTTLTVTVDDDGTNLSNSSTTTSVFYFANPEHSTSQSPPITIGDFVVECDVISTNFGSGSQIAFLLQGITNNFNLSSYTAPYHLKMEKVGTTVKQYIDDTLIRTTTISDRTNYYMGFQLYKTCSIKFKNYRIYDTSTPSERPLNDEEYRIYLYLKNHQLLTMKDLLVAFSNAFGSAETGTTLLNTIHTVDHRKYDVPQFSNDTLKAYDDEDTDITTDLLVDKEGVNLVYNRLAQGTISIQIPDDGWDENFLSLLEEFISIKGNILITTG